MSQPPKAVALKYDGNHYRAPRVIAKGREQVAEKIIDIARENHIPLYEDQNLIQILDALDVDTEIPPELYRAVAEVLAFVYRLDKTLSWRWFEINNCSDFGVGSRSNPGCGYRRVQDTDSLKTEWILSRNKVSNLDYWLMDQNTHKSKFDTLFADG